jgi:ParB family chromosome partitioning protein
LYESILHNDYTVRKVEELVKQFIETGSLDLKQKEPINNPMIGLKETDELKSHLSKLLGTNVQFACGPDGKGKITIPFSTDEELARLMELFDKI